MRKFVLGLATAAVVAIAAIAAPQVASAWGEAEYTGGGQPRFNTYTNVPGVGDEHDFVRVGRNGANTSTFNNNLEACDGEARVSIYIHNGAPEGFNGTDNTGTGVAKDTKLALTVPKTSADPFKAVVSASNAPSVSDTARITCNGEAVELEYVPNTAEIFSQQRDRSVNNALINNTTPIGTYGDNGVVPGCWDFRVYVTLVVKIKKVEQPKPVYKCDALTPVTVDQKANKYKFTARASATNATIKSYVINFGDGASQTINTSAGEATSEVHTFTKDSTVTLTATFMVGDKEVTATSEACKVQVKMNQPPVVTPPVTPTTVSTVTTMPSTGPADTIASAGAVSALAYGVRRWLDSRKAIKA